MKRCSRCTAEKLLDEFFRDRSRPDGRFPWCKACQTAAVIAYRQTEPGKHTRQREARRYAQTPHGKEAHASAKARYRAKPATRAHEVAYAMAYQATPKGRVVKREADRTYRQSEHGRATKRRTRARLQRAHEARHPDRAAARRAVADAIRTGRLQRPAVCARGCSSVPSAGWRGRQWIHAHHHRGYAREHWLDVQWLCEPCHASEEAHVTAPPHSGRPQSPHSTPHVA